MAQPTLPRSVYEETARLFYSSGQNVARAARSAGLAYNTFSSRIRKARELGIITDKSKNEASVVEAKVVVKPIYRIQQRKSKPEETQRVLAIGDCHDGPSLPDKTRFFAMGQYAKINQVDRIVQIGDFASVDSPSRS